MGAIAGWWQPKFDAQAGDTHTCTLLPHTREDHGPTDASPKTKFIQPAPRANHVQSLVSLCPVLSPPLNSLMNFSSFPKQPTGGCEGAAGRAELQSRAEPRRSRAGLPQDARGRCCPLAGPAGSTHSDRSVTAPPLCPRWRLESWLEPWPDHRHEHAVGLMEAGTLPIRTSAAHFVVLV